MCLEISAHGSAEQGEPSRGGGGTPAGRHGTQLMPVMCADHLILEPIRQRTELKATSSSDKDAQQRIRTTFSREQSAALELGWRPRTASNLRERPPK